MTTGPIKREVHIAIGAAARPVGLLTFVRDGRREYSTFAYDVSWLGHRERFEISPDLPLAEGWVTRRAPTPEDSPFPFAIADTEPDAWGARVIRRAHSKRRAEDPSLAPLTRFDYLAAVDDASRVGALRLQNARGESLRAAPEHRTPPLVDLGKIAEATHRVEKGTDSPADLAYLQGKATSLGGLRPKCTVLDEDGALAIGKFPSVQDERSVVRGEVLASKLLALAGCDASAARLVTVEGMPVAVIRRFDRASNERRIPYLSGGSLLQARRSDDPAYSELADAIRRVGAEPARDLAELWRRLIVNLLVTNVDDHLWNVGFLYAGDGKWRLAPAFDVNPFPDKQRESKTWLTEATGPIVSLEQLLDNSAYFGIVRADAEAIAAKAAHATAHWRQVATSAEVGLLERELDDFAPAFEHESARAARALIG